MTQVSATGATDDLQARAPSARQPTGIRRRHGRGCDGAGKCECSWEAAVYDRRAVDPTTGKRGAKIRKTFGTRAEAKAWRAEATTALSKGTMKKPTRQTLRAAADDLLEGMKSGRVRTKDGTHYKPSAIRSYELAWRRHVRPDLGGERLSELQRRHVQALADRMLAAELDASTIRNALMPLRVIYRRALEDGDVAVDPCRKLRLPKVEGKRDRIAAPDEATKLLAALPLEDRALWGTALYGGLRRGELMALRWDDVDLAGGRIRVERSWDPEVGAIEPKSDAGTRIIPIPAVLRDYLDEWKLRCGRSEGLVFGRTAEVPFDPRALGRRAETAWKNAKPKALEPISLHECRHTFASLMIAADVNAKALSTYMGHSSITITLDRYGHLMPGNEDEAAALLDAYLERANTAARLAQVTT